MRPCDFRTVAQASDQGCHPSHVSMQAKGYQRALTPRAENRFHIDTLNCTSVGRPLVAFFPPSWPDVRHEPRGTARCEVGPLRTSITRFDSITANASAVRRNGRWPDTGPPLAASERLVSIVRGIVGTVSVLAPGGMCWRCSDRRRIRGLGQLGILEGLAACRNFAPTSGAATRWLIAVILRTIGAIFPLAEFAPSRRRFCRRVCRRLSRCSHTD